MDAEHIIKQAEATPFRPFRIHTTDGQDYIVSDRTRVGWNTKKDLIVYFDDAGFVVTIDAEHIVEMTHQ